MRTIAEVLSLAASFLKNDRRSAEEILASVLRLKRIDLYMQFDRPLQEEELERMRGALKRKAAGEPIEYIFGACTFYGCQIDVTRDVLIPRQETEILVDLVVKRMGVQGEAWDLCTGSGCIGLALKRARPEWNVTLSDLSPAALAVAEKNARKNSLDVRCVQGDLLRPFAGRKAHLVVCNPPYVSLQEYEQLEPSVKLFEPRLALVGGENGLDFYERLALELPNHLLPGGLLCLELGCSQGEKVKKIFKEKPWNRGELIRDWAGHDRFFFIERE